MFTILKRKIVPKCIINFIHPNIDQLLDFQQFWFHEVLMTYCYQRHEVYEMWFTLQNSHHGSIYLKSEIDCIIFSKNRRMKKLVLRNLALTFTIACLSALLIPGDLSAQYLHVDGKKIVDKNGTEIILRGMGLGGWMLQEGYMLETNAFANPQHQIRAKIKEL